MSYLCFINYSKAYNLYQNKLKDVRICNNFWKDLMYKKVL